MPDYNSYSFYIDISTYIQYHTDCVVTDILLIVPLASQKQK